MNLGLRVTLTTWLLLSLGVANANDTIVQSSISDQIIEIEEQIKLLQKNLLELKHQKQQENKVLVKKVILPEYVQMIGTGGSGFNHSNPSWTHDGKFLGLERHDERNKEILIVNAKGEEIQTVKYQNTEQDDLGLDLLLPEFAENVSYNAGISWSPDNQKFVFMSNGSEGNYDLYLGNIGAEASTRLTQHSEKDGHAHWSPTTGYVTFISGRNGSANVYILNTETDEIRAISNDKLSYLYPQWSPQGDKIAVIHGSNQNHDIYIFDKALSQAPEKRRLVGWEYDDLRPIWSPDGSKIAFYTNYNEANDPKKWSIAVVDVDADLSAPENIISHIVATNIIPDVEKGPAWMPDNQHIVYVQNDRKKYNPIEVVNVNTKAASILKTETNINHDIDISANGLIAFRSQVDQWDHIFIAKLPSIVDSNTNTVVAQ